MWEFESRSVISNPLKVIRSLYEGKDPKKDIGVTQYFRTFVKKYAKEIPSLTGPKSTKRLTPKTLVRVVGMVQNQLANDYSVGSYDIVDEKTGDIQTSECGLYLEEVENKLNGYTHRVNESMLVTRRSVYIIQIPNLSHWVPHETTKPQQGFKSPCDCIVRLYFDLGKNIPMNTAVEFVGIWTPAKGLRPHILNCLFAEELRSGYPLTASFKANPISWEEEITAIRPNTPTIRKEILEIITKALGGDSVLANYVFLHMMSSVPRTRNTSGVLLGYFVLNLIGCPESKVDDSGSFAAGLTRLYQWFLPKVHLCNLDRETMNNERWVPVKNHETDELSFGRFQNTSDTFLLVNETAMSDGKLERNGVPNLRSLVSLVAEQKIDFDFVFHSLSFDTSMPTIIMSHGKSIVECDAMIQVKQDESDVHEVSDLLDTLCGNAKVVSRGSRFIDSLFSEVIPEKLMLWRKYFLLCRQINEKGMEMEKCCSELGQRCFVATRRKNPAFSEGDFHYQLNLVRAITMSYGETTMTIQRYNEMRSLEEDRKDRLPERRKRGMSKSKAGAESLLAGGGVQKAGDMEIES